MIQRAILLGSLLFALALPRVSSAQEEETFTVDEAEQPAEEQPADEQPADEQPQPADDVLGDDSDASSAKADAGKDEVKLGENRGSWQDIVVVIRKPFLKMNRMELVPSWGMTLNDNMIRHYVLDGQFNYWLTDVLAVGLEGQYLVKDFLETFDLVARQDRRLPTINKYNWGAALNFHYVPIYAKFAVFNKNIVHLETFFTAGVGVTETEIVPRDPALPGWTNMLITPNIGITMRTFLTRWITLNLAVKDYIFLDKYEAVDRTADQSLDQAKDNADSKLVNHIMFQAGLSFFFPTSFRYTTFR